VQNWDSLSPPRNDISASVVLDAASRQTSTIDAAWSLNSLTFGPNSNIFFVGGQPLTIGAGGITSQSHNKQNLSFPAVLAADQTWNLGALGLSDSGSINTNGYALTVMGSQVDVGGQFSGGITGSGSLVVAMTGQSMLDTNGANTYSGGTFLNSGGLYVYGDATLGATGAPIVFNGGFLNAFTMLPFTINRDITLGPAGGTITVSGTKPLTLSSTIHGPGSLTLTNGTLQLTGTNTYSGGTFVSGGPLVGTTNSLQGNISISQNSSSGVQLEFSQNFNGTFAGNISGSGSVTILGTGVLSFTGNNTYTGKTTMWAGVLEVSATGGGLTPSGVLNFQDNPDQPPPIVQFVGGGSFTRPLSQVTLSASGGFAARDGNLTVNLGGHGDPFTLVPSSNLVFGSPTANSVTDFQNQIYLGATQVYPGPTVEVDSGAGGDYAILSGVIFGGNSFTKTGNGRLLLTATNTYTGATMVSAGTLVAGNASAFGVNSAAMVTGGVLSLNGYNVTFGSLYGTGGTVNNNSLAASTLTVGSNNFSTSFSGSIADGSTGALSLVKVGTGTLTLTGTNTYTGGTTVTNGILAANSGSALGNGPTLLTGGTLRVGNASVFGSGSIVTITGGALSLNGNNVTIGTLTGTGGTINNGSATAATLTVGSSNVSTTYGGSIADGSTGGLALAKIGTGTLTLTGSNAYSGGTNINNGILAVASDAALGTGPITFTALSTLNYLADNSSTRSFTLGTGTLAVATGATLTLNGGTIASGFLGGGGTFATSSATGAQFGAVTSRPAVTIQSNNGNDQFVNFTNGGTMTVAANLTSPVTFNGFTNQGSGSITVGQNSQVNATDFQSYGTVTLQPGSFNGVSGGVTQITNTGGAAMYFNTGSRTFISTVAQVANQNAGIDLHGSDAVVAGGLFVNNGFVYDSTGTNHRVIADYGSLVKGAGYWQTLPRTQNGGTFIAGNSPGRATTGNFYVGGPNDPNQGLSNYTWQINDAGPSTTYPSAPGLSGPSPNMADQVSGWGVLAGTPRTPVPPPQRGDMHWDATSTDRFTIHLNTLLAPYDAGGNPSAGGGYEPVGDNSPGPMSHFDPSMSYGWKLFQYAGSYFGPTDTATLDASTNFDTAGFLNPYAGRFDWVLNQTTDEMDLVYTPTAVPEPSMLAPMALACMGWSVYARRRGRNRNVRHRSSGGNE
jgi:autotransporter-associated beta strand protein